MAFEVAQRLEAALAVGLSGREVFGRRAGRAGRNHGDAVKGAVELPVAAAVKALPFASGGDRDGSAADVASEAGLVLKRSMPAISASSLAAG